MRSGIIIGTFSFATAASSTHVARSSATISQDYEAALKRHYERGAPPDWPERFVSAYATSHPWEDFAETWAHYLHIVDTLETANAFGVKIAPAVDKRGDASPRSSTSTPMQRARSTGSSTPGRRSSSP